MNTEIWLWILLVMMPHNPRTMQIVNSYEDVRSAAIAMRDGDCQLMSEQEMRRAHQIRNRDVKQLMKVCSSNDIRIITIEDEEYPSLLRGIPDPPVVLFVQGSLAELDSANPIAVVGTRTPTEYGVKATTRVCNGLAVAGITIISGLAVGLDTTAHRCALDKNARTIGVLACGNLVDYPKESAELKKEIVAAGGAIISELLPYTESRGSYFHRRNRIISGLCMGTLVTEAPVRSGCLLTADHTIEQERLLFCIPPHDITLAACAGVIRYLRCGAIPCFSHLDIINSFHSMVSKIDKEALKNSIDDLELFIMREEMLRQEGISRRRKKSSEKSIPAESDKKIAVSNKPEAKKSIITDEILNTLDENSATLLRLINDAPHTTDELIELTGLGYLDVTSALTDLEISGYISLNADSTYSVQ